MDQNENKNLESVAEKATEVKDEVVEAAIPIGSSVWISERSKGSKSS